jgi:hypothetical protein
LLRAARNAALNKSFGSFKAQGAVSRVLEIFGGFDDPQPAKASSCLSLIKLSGAATQPIAVRLNLPSIDQKIDRLIVRLVVRLNY